MVTIVGTESHIMAVALPKETQTTGDQGVIRLIIRGIVNLPPLPHVPKRTIGFHYGNRDRSPTPPTFAHGIRCHRHNRQKTINPVEIISAGRRTDARIDRGHWITSKGTGLVTMALCSARPKQTVN